MKIWKKYFAALATLLCITLILFIYGYKEYTRTLPDTGRLEPQYRLKAGELLRQFESDEASTAAKYTDKVLSVRGAVYACVETDTSATVFLNDGGSSSSVMCQFDQDHIREIAEVREGDTLTVKGICSGYIMDVVLVRCTTE